VARPLVFRGSVARLREQTYLFLLVVGARASGEISAQKDKRIATSVIQHFDQNIYEFLQNNFFLWKPKINKADNCSAASG
jgi:hypothetical protein